MTQQPAANRQPEKIQLAIMDAFTSATEEPTPATPARRPVMKYDYNFMRASREVRASTVQEQAAITEDSGRQMATARQQDRREHKSRTGYWQGGQRHAEK